MEWITETEAKKDGLMQLIEWQTHSERGYLESEVRRIGSTKGRVAKLVKKGCMYSCFVNPVA